MDALRERCKPDAADGRYELYKLSLRFDNPESRLAHGFPLDTTAIGSPRHAGFSGKHRPPVSRKEISVSSPRKALFQESIVASKYEWNRRSFIKGAAVLGAAPLFTWRQYGTATTRSIARCRQERFRKSRWDAPACKFQRWGLADIILARRKPIRPRRKLSPRRLITVCDFLTMPGNITMA